MKTWPGNENWGVENIPWNIFSKETLAKTLTDRGSFATMLSDVQLRRLENENNDTLLSVLDELGTSSLDNKRRAYFEVDIQGVMAIYGAAVYLGSTYKFNYETATNMCWHKVRRHKGFYKNNQAGSGGSGDNVNVQLTEMPTLIDDDYTTASVTAIVNKDINIGVEVGGEEFGQIYENVVDSLVIVASNSNARNFSIYKSTNNQTWTPVTKSTYSSNGWNQGEKIVSNFRASGVTGVMVKLANLESGRFFKAVQTGTPAAAYDLYECMALNLQGECRYSDDLNNWKGAIRDAAFTDYLLYRFDQGENEVRAVEFYFEAFRCESTKAARLDIDHVELFADTQAVDFGKNGDLRSLTITSGELGGTGEGQQLLIRNDDPYGRTAKKFYAHIPIGPRTVTQTLTSGVATGQLADSARRVTYARYILGADHSDIGVLGDTSVVPGGNMALWVEVDWTATPSGDEYAVNYNTGAIKTGNNIPAGSTMAFAYANPGAAALQISNDNSSWVNCGYGNRITLASTEIVVGATAYLYLLSNLTHFDQSVEDIIRTGLVLVEALFQGD